LFETLFSLFHNLISLFQHLFSLFHSLISLFQHLISLFHNLISLFTGPYFFSQGLHFYLLKLILYCTSPFLFSQDHISHLRDFISLSSQLYFSSHRTLFCLSELHFSLLNLISLFHNFISLLTWTLCLHPGLNFDLPNLIFLFHNFISLLTGPYFASQNFISIS